MSKPMRRDFANRHDLINYLHQQFPDAAAISEAISTTSGGRLAAEKVLQAIDPAAYETSRNHVDGHVTHLSPYIRHGVLSLAEVRERAQQESRVNKLVQELGWRDFFQRVYKKIGRHIWQDQEPYKTGFSAKTYSDDFPADIKTGTTGLVCIDSFVLELLQTGYLHNHARMWLAGYIIHWRRIKWQAGARWFLQHLLDGDPASNNLSWQWVASTYSHKPYFFNRENIERFSAGKYCQECPIYGRCTFEGSYPQLEQKLFPHKPPKRNQPPRKNKKKKRKRWHQ